VTADISARRAAEDALRVAQSELGRVARLTTVGAMAATIAHEINQPLAAIVANGSAGLRWLDRPDPNLEEVQSALGRVVKDGHPALEFQRPPPRSAKAQTAAFIRLRTSHFVLGHSSGPTAKH
jgi:signal transduction histidine kinase